MMDLNNIGHVPLNNFLLGKWKRVEINDSLENILIFIMNQTIEEVNTYDSHLQLIIQSILNGSYLDCEPFVSKKHVMSFDFTTTKNAINENNLKVFLEEFRKFVMKCKFIVLKVGNHRCSSAVEFQLGIQSILNELNERATISFTGSDQPGHMGLRRMYASILVKMHTMKYSLTGILKMAYKMFGFENFLETEFNVKRDLHGCPHGYHSVEEWNY